MKLRARAVVISFLIATFVTALVWGGGILYWHVRIRSALRDLESTCHSEPLRDDERARHDGAPGVLMEGGCRSLPYLFNSLDESRNPEFLTTVAFLIA